MSDLDTKKPLDTNKPQHQSHQPGAEHKMNPEPRSHMEHYKAAGKLMDKVALITGADSGIGRAAAIGFAKEGADVAIIYLDSHEHKDAQLTKELIEQEGRLCHLIKGDIADEKFCQKAIDETVEKLGRLNILVNNAAQQFPVEKFEDITQEQLLKTYSVNIFPMFYLTKYALKHLKEGDTIINTASVTAYHGNEQLIDYASTKGAIVTLTRSLSQQLAERKIRVNAVAPGPIWTPLIPSSFDAKQVAEFGKDTPMKRPGQPDEVGPCYVFLASDDSSYMTGQVLHPNGGKIVNG